MITFNVYHKKKKTDFQNCFKQTVILTTLQFYLYIYIYPVGCLCAPGFHEIYLVFLNKVYDLPDTFIKPTKCSDA